MIAYQSPFGRGGAKILLKCPHQDVEVVLVNGATDLLDQVGLVGRLQRRVASACGVLKTYFLAEILFFWSKYFFISLQKMLKNVRDLGKLIVAKGLKKLPKVQKIAQSGHTIHNTLYH